MFTKNELFSKYLIYKMSCKDLTRLNLAYKATGRNTPIDHLISLDIIIEMLQDSPAIAHTILELDLSFSFLFDEDYNDIITIVKLLPNCRLVNLCGLSIRDITSADIRYITTLPNVRYVIICKTMLASTACWRMYNDLTACDFSKLIFMSEPPTHAFYKIVRNPDMHHVCMETHRQFYNLNFNHSINTILE
jgi:hypothetical protein